MRIIGGQYKGRKFSGKIPSNIRPTTDNVRESIFNILANLIDFNDIILADIFAGTGMLGFEAISRGASSCYFFDNNFKSINLIQNIAKELKLNNETRKIVKGDAIKKIKTFKQDYHNLQFDLIFIDPPYKLTDFNELLIQINQLQLIKNNGVIVVEHSILKKLLLTKELKIEKSKIFGETQIDFVIKS